MLWCYFCCMQDERRMKGKSTPNPLVEGRPQDGEWKIYFWVFFIKINPPAPVRFALIWCRLCLCARHASCPFGPRPRKRQTGCLGSAVAGFPVRESMCSWCARGDRSCFLSAFLHPYPTVDFSHALPLAACLAWCDRKNPIFLPLHPSAKGVIPRHGGMSERARP